MSELQELIQKLCPDGVEYKKLEDIGDFFGGLTGKSKEDFKDGNSKFITYRNVYANPSLNIDFEDKVKISDNEKQHTVTYGDILFTGSSETPDECGMSSVVTTQTSEKLYLNSFCFGLRLYKMEEFNLHYLKHILRSNDIREQIKKTASGVTRYNVSKKRFAKIYIPVPPIEVQTEIAHILDDFTDLAAELQAELQARKSQYEYYRNQLLAYSMEESDQSSLRSNRSATSIQNSDNSTQPLSTLNPHTGNSVLQPRGKVEWKVLEEVVEIKRGKRLIKNQLEKTGKYAVYQNCMIPLGYYHKNNVIADTTFIISAGSAGEIGYSDVDFWAADDVYYFVTKNDLKSRFLYHFLITQQQKIYSQVRRSSVPRLSKTAFEKLLIPIPPLEEQERIVSILDKFDTLTTSLTEGLPKEIELRQKQYEYYRNMLLSFPKNNIKA